MGLPAVLSSCPKAKTTQEWLRRNVPAFISAEDWSSGSPYLNPWDYKLWTLLEDIACQKRHKNLDSLKRSLVKAVAEIPLETVRSEIAKWPELLKLASRQRAVILSGIIINKILKLLLINYLARKVAVLFHFPSGSQNPCNRTYGKTMYHATQKRNSTYLYTVTCLAIYAQKIRIIKAGT